MLTYNIDQLSGLVNGSRGVIIGFTEHEMSNCTDLKIINEPTWLLRVNKTNEAIKSDSTFHTPSSWKILKQGF